MVNIPSLSHYYWLVSHNYWLPSGKRLHSYGKSPALIGKSANDMAISATLNDQNGIVNYCDIRYSKSICNIWDVWNITGLFTSICDICGYVWYTISIWTYLQSWYEWKITGILDWTINGILASGYYWNNITYNTIRDIWIHTHIYIYIYE